MIIYACDFFVANKEAISNQMELLRSTTNSIIISSPRFMGQRSFALKDILKKRLVVPEKMYIFLLRNLPKCFGGGVHYFEEEPSAKMRSILDLSGKPVYITMYRRPGAEYADHLKKILNLKTVFVELESHKKILVKCGVPASKVEVVGPPSIFNREKSKKKFDQNNINLLYASWNMAEPNALEDRGLVFLIKLLAENENLSLTIPLRDNKTKEFLEVARSHGVRSRIDLIDRGGMVKLRECYQNCDFVVFCPTSRISKDIPNSIIDGITFGKPCIVSNVIDFHEEVKKNNIGIIIDCLKVGKLKIDSARYKYYSENAFEFSKNFTKSNYLETLRFYE